MKTHPSQFQHSCVMLVCHTTQKVVQLFSGGICSSCK